MHHDHKISLSMLKQLLHRQECIRDQLYRSIAIKDELSGSGSSIGYRIMYRSLLDKGLICRR